jgi:hypothetical protein
MKKVWKWVIGIAVVLVVVAALVAGAFLMRSHVVNAVAVAKVARPGIQVPGNGKLPPNQVQPGIRGHGMMPFGNDGWGRGRIVMRGPGMMGFGRRMPFGGIFGGLVCLGFLALVVLGVIRLVRRLRQPAAVSAPVTPVAEVAQVAAPVAPVAPLAVVHPCAKCGEPVQDGWKHCPNCGKKQ